MKQGTSKAHGEPPGSDELHQAKERAKWQVEPGFFIPDDVREHFLASCTRGAKQESDWKSRFQAYQEKSPGKAAEFLRRVEQRLPEAWETCLPTFPADPKGMGTRVASGKCLNSMSGKLPELIGGSADLAPSNNSWMDGIDDFQAPNPEGRNFHFGVREHAMGAVVNGMALHRGVMPYGATFLVFSDYMRGALRISALSHIPSIWIFTHDSIGVGEDGPTHQPVEHLAALRAIPNMLVIRPADGNETVEAWKVAVNHRGGPTTLVLTRQALPTLDRSIYTPASELKRGAYVLADIGDKVPDVILMASGSEVNLILDAGMRLGAEGVNVRIVSFPCWELFSAQDREYQEAVLPPIITHRLAVEAGVSQGWERWTGSSGRVIGMNQFGASAPAKILFEQFGFTVQKILDEVREMVR